MSAASPFASRTPSGPTTTHTDRPATASHRPPLRPLSVLALELLITVAPLPRCEHLLAYLPPLLTVETCEGYYGLDRVAGIVGYVLDALDFQEGLAPAQRAASRASCGATCGRSASRADGAARPRPRRCGWKGGPPAPGYCTGEDREPSPRGLTKVP